MSEDKMDENVESEVNGGWWRKMLPPLILMMVGVVGAVLMIEVGVRLVYLQLPFSWQSQLSGARVWGIAGEPLGALIEAQSVQTDFYSQCVGDDRLFGRLKPNLDGVPILTGETTWHLTTEGLGFEEIGFRSEAAEEFTGVVVGDSFAMCMSVEADECWVTTLSQDSGVAWANLGMVGTGSYSHLHYLEDYGWPLAPEVVVWQFYINDFGNDYEHQLTEAVGCPREEAVPEGDEVVAEPAVEPLSSRLKGGLSRTFVSYNVMVPLLKGELLNNVSQQTIPFFEQFETIHGQTFVVHFSGYEDEVMTNTGIGLTQEALLAAQAQAAAREVPFLLLIAPANFQVYREILPEDIPEPILEAAAAWDAHLDGLVAFAEESEIDYVDLRPFLQEQAAAGVELYQDFDTHWTAEGNRLVGEYVTAVVQERYGVGE